MKREIRSDYEQALLLPPSVEDWVPPDHPVRVVREFVESLDLEELGFANPAQRGRPRYATGLLISIVLYGWMTRVRSSRAIEKACRETLPFIWLTGNNPPDHNTIARLYKKHGKALSGLFRQTVRVADSMGLVEMVTHALDGSKMLAASSNSKVESRKSLERRKEILDREIAKILARIAEQMDSNDGVPDERLPEELQDRVKLREKVEESLRQHDETGQDFLNPDETDARVMKTRQGGPQLAYNAQAVVDAGSDVLVAIDVVSDQNDRKQLIPMIEKAEENLGRKPEDTVADAGYHTASAIAAAEAAGHGVILNEQENPERCAGDVDLRSSNFSFDREQDVCRCPLGKALEFERTKTSKQGNEVRVYRCRESGCPLASTCTKDRRGRSIEISEHHESVRRHRAKRTEARSQEKLRKRPASIERVFAMIKSILDFRRFSVRGLEGVQVQWSLAGSAHNLWKIIKWRAVAAA